MNNSGITYFYKVFRHVLESRGLYFVRYADDSIIFVKSEKAAQRVLQSVTTFIEKKLGLIVNAEKSKISRSRPNSIKFFRFRFLL